MEPTKPRHPGQFKPGQSGNPKGRKPSGETLADAVRAKWPPEKLVELQSKWAASSDAGVSQRAIDWLADRGYGRVRQDVDLGVSAVGPEAQAMLGALALTPHERREKLRAVQPLAGDADD